MIQARYPIVFANYLEQIPEIMTQHDKKEKTNRQHVAIMIAL